MSAFKKMTYFSILSSNSLCSDVAHQAEQDLEHPWQLHHHCVFVNGSIGGK